MKRKAIVCVYFLLSVTCFSCDKIDLEKCSGIDFAKLMELYNPSKADISISTEKKSFLMSTIIPSDFFIFSGSGETLNTNKGIVLDLSSMTVNCILGQNDPWVSHNMSAYILSGRPSFHSTRLGSEVYYKFIKRLYDLKISGIENPVFNHRQCNGSDVVELAIKAAFNNKGGRTKFVSFKGSYHGQNLTAFLISEIQKQHKFLIDYECVFLDSPPHSDLFLEERDLIPDEQEILLKLQEIINDTYGVIIEPIQMNNGINVCSQSFLKELRKVCTQNNVCLIFDEIQTGFGWLGSLSAADLLKISPDIALFSKSLTSGFGPLAIMVSSPKYSDFEYGTSEKTNGADLRSLVAANAVLDRLIGLECKDFLNVASGKLMKDLENGLLLHYDKKVTSINAELDFLLKKHKLISRIKGFGLIKGIEISDILEEDSSLTACKIVNECLKKGVFLRRTHNVLIIKPPIVISEPNIQKSFSVIDEVLSSFEY